MIRQNLHTHSVYDDGKDTIDEMVQTAADKGFTILGFSGHGYNPIDSGSMTPEKTECYRKDVQKWKAHPPKGMKIYLGIEEDSLSPIDPGLYDYVIGSVHYLQKDGQTYAVDYSKEEFERMLNEGFGGDVQAMCKAYYQAIEAQARNPRADIIGHIDLIAKYNENEDCFSFSDPQILEAAQKAVNALVKAGKIFEMNTGAMARGYRSEPYPHPAILKMSADAGGKLLINTDCHNRQNLDLGIERCLQLAKQAGFEQLYTLSDAGFVPWPINEFF